jgi:soluble lytic murein transglycosylase-like protein
MIGNLMSRMADADKLSVSQLNVAVKNGTIPAYIGVPLIQEKMRAKQAAQATVAQSQAQPPIAQQVMEEADLSTGLEKLQSNLPSQGYAGGGIVAFADGGLAPNDDENTEDEDKALFSRLMAGISALKEPEEAGGEMPVGEMSAGEMPRRTGESAPVPKVGRTGHKFEGAVLEEAKRQGVDPNLALHVLYKETGGLKNPESARSSAGALGVMQIMPGTAKDLGIDPLDPGQNIRGGVSYLKQMMDKYQDPVLAAAAYNAGPGRVDKALKSGYGIASLPRETQNYVPRMAGGGVVALQAGGMPKGLDDLTPEELAQMNQPFIGYKPFRQPGLSALQQRALGFQHQRQMEQEDIDATPAYDKLMGGAQPATVPQNTPAAAPASTPAPNPMGDQAGIAATEGMGTLDDIKNMIKTGMEDSAKQKRVDTMLSLLTAGLGMMGGTSPYAAVNIGQGGQQGVGAMLAARKTQAEEQKGLLGAQLGLSRAELYEKMRRDALTQKAETTKFNQGIQQQRLDATKALIPIKQQEAMLKVNKAWEESSFKPQLESQMVKEFGKNWNVPGSKAELAYKSRKAAWLRDNAGIGASNIPTADSILANINQ